MNKVILDLYKLMIDNKDTVSKIICSEKNFILNRDYLNYGYGLIKQISENFFRLDNIFVFSNKVIEMKTKELAFINKYLINSYNQINGYLIYDFLKTEYSIILEELKKILEN